MTLEFKHSPHPPPRASQTEQSNTIMKQKMHFCNVTLVFTKKKKKKKIFALLGNNQGQDNILINIREKTVTCRTWLPTVQRELLLVWDEYTEAEDCKDPSPYRL